MTRREFLINSYRAGGLAALLGLGLSMDAIADVIVGVKKKAPVSSDGTNTSWATWDEATEAGFGDADVLIYLLENVNAGGNETAQGGGLAGDDLVLTQSGNVAGALGAPPTRVMDGANDFFTATKGFANNFLAVSSWAMVIKIVNYTRTNGTFFFDFYGTSRLYAYLNVTKFRIGETDDVGGAMNITTADDLPATGSTLYLYLDWDGTTLQAGFDTVKRNTWASIPAGQKASNATYDCTFASGEFDTGRAFFSAFDGLSGWMAGSAAYVVMKKNGRLLT